MEIDKIVEKIKEFFRRCYNTIVKIVKANKYKVLIGGFIIIVIVVGCTTIKGDNNVIVKGNNDSVVNDEIRAVTDYNICTATNCNCPCKHIGE